MLPTSTRVHKIGAIILQSKPGAHINKGMLQLIFIYFHILHQEYQCNMSKKSANKILHFYIQNVVDPVLNCPEGRSLYRVVGWVIIAMGVCSLRMLHLLMKASFSSYQKMGISQRLTLLQLQESSEDHSKPSQDDLYRAQIVLFLFMKAARLLCQKLYFIFLYTTQ